MQSLNLVELKNYTTIKVNFESKNLFCPYKNCSFVLIFKISLPRLLHLNQWKQPKVLHYMKLSYSTVIVCYVKLWQVFFPTEKAFAFIFSKMNWQTIINKTFSYIYKFVVLNLFYFRNVLTLIKDTSVVCVYVHMTIWQSLLDIIYI